MFYAQLQTVVGRNRFLHSALCCLWRPSNGHRLKDSQPHTCRDDAKEARVTPVVFRLIITRRSGSLLARISCYLRSISDACCSALGSDDLIKSTGGPCLNLSTRLRLCELVRLLQVWRPSHSIWPNVTSFALFIQLSY